ncbi:MAG: STAS domain-containing protein [Treponema sp.]|nr:STAS domain-containing protein [Treponema sp.]
MEQLAISEKRGANYILYELKGACNSYTIADISTKIFEEIKTTNVVIDMSAVTDLDSSGMGMLFAGFNDGLQYHHKLYLLGLSFAAQKTVTDTGFLEAFNVIQSVTEVE